MRKLFPTVVIVSLTLQIAAFAAEATLQLGVGNGALGSKNNIVKVYLNNDVPVHGLQISVADIPDYLTPDSIWVAGRAADFIVSSQDDTTGILTIILISFDPLKAIQPDTGAVLNISYSVAADVNDLKLLDLIFYAPPTVYNKQLGKIPTTTINSKFVIGSTAVSEKNANAPASFELLPNYPNPFNPGTHIAFHMPRLSRVTVDIFNLLGQRIRNLTDREYTAGRYELLWNGLDDRGEPVAAGIYLYRLKTEHFTQTRRMILAK